MYKLSISLLILVCNIFFQLQAEPTRLIVRALANDAKFIGSSMGSPKVVISAVQTGEVLAEGWIEGGTGNTDLLMRQPHQRYQRLSDEGTGKFEAVLDLEQPTKIKIEVFAPAFEDQNQGVASRVIWMIPGEDILGDGIVMDISGFVIELIEPYGRQSFTTDEEIPVQINATMMCGCPISAGGLWDANRFKVTGLLQDGRKTVNHFDLDYAGNTNQFEGSIKVIAPGNYLLWVYMVDPETGNTGVDQVSISVE